MANYAMTGGIGKIASIIEDILAGGNDALVFIPMATSGTAEQAEGLADFAAVEADANFSEQTGTGWSRIVHDETGDGLAITFDTANNRKEADGNDLVWPNPSVGDTTGVIICHDTDTTSGADANLVPLAHLDMVIVANGQQATFQFNAEGWANMTRV